MKKKCYVKPCFEVIWIELENPIATSVVVTSSSGEVNESWVEDDDVTKDISWN